MLSGGSPRDLLRAITSGDTAALVAVPGVGKRTAERIIVELREKVGAVAESDPIAVIRGPVAEAREALEGLGFSQQEADELLSAASGETAEELVAAALRGAKR